MSHDLRYRVQRLTDLRRRYEAHDPLTDEEMEELRVGISAEEYRSVIIPAIRKERESARPSKKTKAAAEQREKEPKEQSKKSTPIDIDIFSI